MLRDSSDSQRDVSEGSLFLFLLGNVVFERLKRQWLRWSVINEAKAHLQIPPLLLLLLLLVPYSYLFFFW